LNVGQPTADGLREGRRIVQDHVMPRVFHFDEASLLQNGGHALAGLSWHDDAALAPDDEGRAPDARQKRPGVERRVEEYVAIEGERERAISLDDPSLGEVTQDTRGRACLRWREAKTRDRLVEAGECRRRALGHDTGPLGQGVGPAGEHVADDARADAFGATRGAHRPAALERPTPPPRAASRGPRSLAWRRTFRRYSSNLGVITSVAAVCSPESLWPWRAASASAAC